MFETGVDGITVTKVGKKNLCMDFKISCGKHGFDFGKVPDFEKTGLYRFRDILVQDYTKVSSGGPDTGGQRADAGRDFRKKNDL